MSLSLIAGIASGLANIGGGLLARRSHNKYADFLNEQKVEMPGAIGAAESEFRGMASQGLPGKDAIADDIQSQIARTLGLGKEVADSPSVLLDLLAKSNESATSSVRQLGVQDASAKLQNRAMLADFLSRAKAPMELNIANQNMELGIASQRERMMGTQELLQGITNGLGGMTTGFANHETQKYMKDKIAQMDNWFGLGGAGSSVVPSVDEAIQTGSSLSGLQFRNEATNALLQKGIAGDPPGKQISDRRKQRYMTGMGAANMQSAIKRGNVENTLERQRKRFGDGFINDFWDGYFGFSNPKESYDPNAINSVFQGIGLRPWETGSVNSF
jgi:hypothetical protein